jgi:DNA-binding beta-propeller fold protein YncE
MTVADLFVPNSFNDTVVQFDQNGVHQGLFVQPGNGGVLSPTGITFGPDGNLYLTSSLGKIHRYHGTSGAPIDVFASHAEINAPRALRFGPDGDLYLAEHDGQVLRFDGQTGTFDRIFTSGGDLFGVIDIEWGPDGDLYVSDDERNLVKRFDGMTGLFIDDFTKLPPGESLDKPKGVRFGLDGHLYLSDSDNNRVVRFDGITGDFIDAFVSGELLNQPQGIEFKNGQLYVANLSDRIVRYNAADRTLNGNFTHASLTQPQFFAFRPVPEPVSAILLTLGGLAALPMRRRG